jgi:HNH endonuclease
MPTYHTVRRGTSPAIHVIGPSIAYIELTKGYYALVDAEDADCLACWNWKASAHGGDLPYATRLQNIGNGRQISILMHRVLCFCDRLVDHKNMNRLDNRKSNLRPATRKENSRNRKISSKTGFKGIFKCGRKWSATIRLDGKATYLGNFHTKEQANAAYTSAAQANYGEFARG